MENKEVNPSFCKPKEPDTEKRRCVLLSLEVLIETINKSVSDNEHWDVDDIAKAVYARQLKALDAGGGA